MQCTGMQFVRPWLVTSANKKTRQELSMRFRRICAYMGCKVIGSAVDLHPGKSRLSNLCLLSNATNGFPRHIRTPPPSPLKGGTAPRTQHISMNPPGPAVRQINTKTESCYFSSTCSHISIRFRLSISLIHRTPLPHPCFGFFSVLPPLCIGRSD